MATSGYRDEWVTKWDTLRLSWSRTGYSIANNESYISWSLQLISSSYGAINSSASRAWSVNINGNAYSGTTSVSIGNNTTKTLASGSTTIPHNNDGTKTFAYSFSQSFQITFSGSWIGTVSGSSTGPLDSIPRTSSVSATNATIGSATTITISRAASSFTHTLRYSFCNLSATIVDKTSSTSYSWTLPDSFYGQIPNSTSSWGTIFCDTYSGSTLIGTSSCRFNVYINESACQPTLSPTVVDVGSYSTTFTGDPNKIILNFNVVKVDFNASAKKSATISSMKVTCGNATRYSDGYMDYVSNGTFVFTVTDSRGYSATKTITKETIDYTPLTCNLYANSNLVDGSTANVNITISGNYFQGSFGAVTNSLTVEYRYKINDGEYPDTWTTKTATISNGKYTLTDTITGLDYTDSCTIQARAKDVIYTSGVNAYDQFVKIYPVFDWSKNDFNFNVPVHSTGGFTYDIPSFEANVDEMLTSGLFYMQASSTNKPGGWNGWLTVMALGDGTQTCYQRYINYKNDIYERWRDEGTWTDWQNAKLRSYPVNSIYISYSHTSPASLFGGTWTRIENRFLWGCDAYGDIGATGGEHSHTLSIDEIPSHSHPFISSNQYSQAANGWVSPTWGPDSISTSARTGDAGGGGAHNNMPPYIHVSFWRRTA